MRQRITKDTRAEYLSDETKILNQAEAILRKRLERIGTISNPQDASEFFRMRLGGLEHEEFHVAFLDNLHRIQAVELMFRGGIDSAEVHPREVVKAVLRHNSAAIIIAHGHPSGNPVVSEADKRITSRLQQALLLIDVRILDHLVVGETVTSMALQGLL